MTVGSSTGPPPASVGQQHPWVSCSLPSAGKMLLPSGCLPTKHVFWSRFPAPARGGSQGNAAKHVCAVAETARWPGCGVELEMEEPEMAGPSLPGDPAAGGGPGLGTETPCAAAAACQRQERAVIHRLPSR